MIVLIEPHFLIWNLAKKSANTVKTNSMLPIVIINNDISNFIKSRRYNMIYDKENEISYFILFYALSDKII